MAEDNIISTKISPVYLLRRFAWAVLKSKMGYSLERYGGKNPIVPLNEEPEFAGQYDPYIVYGYSMNPQGEMHAVKHGTISFVVYTENFGVLTQILTEFENAFGRYDESARDINEFTSLYSPNRVNRPFLGIRFNSTHVTFVEGGTPEEQEGDRMSGFISIAFSYSVDHAGDYSVISDVLDAEGDPVIG